MLSYLVMQGGKDHIQHTDTHRVFTYLPWAVGSTARLGEGAAQAEKSLHLAAFLALGCWGSEEGRKKWSQPAS